MPTRWATSRCSTASASSASPPAGAYGHTVRQSLAFAYVESAYAEPGTTFEIEILGERRAATVQAEPLYDPGNERLRA